MIKSISKDRFEVLSFSRKPTVKLYSNELEWYSDDDETVIGAIVFDLDDSDWGFVILGRNEAAVFCCIDLEVNFPSLEKAREALYESMLRIVSIGKKIFPQEPDIKKHKIFNLFNPIVPIEKQHPFFKYLSNDPGFSSAKELLAELAHTYEDPDGNYIQQFQSDGFDSRLWEIYLYAVLHENDFLINRNFHAPDYVCLKFGSPLVLEAATVNPTKDGEIVESVKLDPDGIEMANYVAIKFANVLYAKLQKRYWDLPHVSGKPLILAVADFKKPDGVFFSAKFVQEYLYGRRQSRDGDRFVYTPIIEHTCGSRKKPSGFFSLPESENISAVLFSDGGTISKFTRMGKIAGFGKPYVKLFRFGMWYESSRSLEATEFRVTVEPPEYKETWSEGIYLFHNGKAKYPIDPSVFPGASHTIFLKERFFTSVPDHFPIWSKTVHLCPRDEEK